jgi:SAM-dependent methyltransferase
LNFWRAQPQNAAGKEALIIGCGYGDDAEQFARWGFQTTAFDISETAIRGARRRFPESEVAYVASDVLAPPPEWRQKFDLVFESYTLQVLPPDLRVVAILKIAELVGVSGVLLVIARGREATESEGQMPWPLTRDELSAFKRAGLDEISFEDFLDAETPPVRRFRALYKRG